MTVRAAARRGRRAGPLVVGVLALVSPALAPAQVTARQGEAAKEVVTEFESPMVLDVPLKGYDSVPSGASKMLGGFRSFVCEDASLVSLKVVKRDPDDDRVLECALHSGAGVIVSGDEHLLTLGSYRDMRILSAATFAEEFLGDGPASVPEAKETPARYRARKRRAVPRRRKSRGQALK